MCTDVVGGRALPHAVHGILDPFRWMMTLVGGKRVVIKGFLPKKCTKKLCAFSTYHAIVVAHVNAIAVVGIAPNSRTRAAGSLGFVKGMKNLRIFVI